MTQINSLSLLKKLPERIQRKTAVAAVKAGYEEGFAAGVKSMSEPINNAQDDIAKIISTVCEVCHVSKDDLIGDVKTFALADARKIVSYMAKDYCTSLKEVGRLTGRDHATVSSHIRRYAELYSNDRLFRSKAIEVRKLLKK